MFGKGVYLADTSSKSANYCCSWNSANQGLLLLCDAELGDPMFELAGSDYMAGENAKNEGKIATLGKGISIPGGWKDASVVHEDLKGVMIPDVGVTTFICSIMSTSFMMLLRFGRGICFMWI
jgi:poly [ADP-ribose] polymerase